MSNSKYEAQALTVDRLLAPDAALFVVPPFQRRYSWDEQIAELLADLYDDLTWADDADQTPYFLGSVVLAKNLGSPDAILDGQQRLTTISLLLSVLKDKLNEVGYSDSADMRKYLMSGQLGKKKMAKVQLQPEDEGIYGDLLSDPRTYAESTRKHPLLEAAKKIETVLEQHIASAFDMGISRQDALELLANKVLHKVEFVIIVAPSESSAFQLFETLNDRGLALGAADLIKNKLFAQCGQPHLDDVKEYWQDAIEAVDLGDFVNFLRYFWIATHSEVRKEGLFDAYKNQIGKMRANQVRGFAEKLRDAATQYLHIWSPNPDTCPWGSETGEGLKRLVIFGARSCRPALLACALFNKSQMPTLVKACESITVRYSMVGGLNPNQLERAYGELCHRIREQPENISALLNTEMSRHIPADKDFEEQFAQIEVSRTPPWREILIRLNEQLSTGETKVRDSRYVHVEHILPRNPSEQALDESGLSRQQAEAAASHIGNLTLLSGRTNREISNGPFSIKRPSFDKSEIRLNAEIAACTCWGVDEILARAKSLAEIAMKVWPWPIENIV